MTNEKLIDLIVSNMRDNKVDIERRLDALDSKFDKLSEEVRLLANFKWKIIGVASGASVVVAAIFQVIVLILKKG